MRERADVDIREVLKRPRAARAAYAEILADPELAERLTRKWGLDLVCARAERVARGYRYLLEAEGGYSAGDAAGLAKRCAELLVAEECEHNRWPAMAAVVAWELLELRGNLVRRTRGGRRVRAGARPKHGLGADRLAQFAFECDGSIDAGMPPREAREKAAKELGVPPAWGGRSRDGALRRLHFKGRKALR